MAGSPPARQQWPQIATHGQFQIEELSRFISRAPQQALRLGCVLRGRKRPAFFIGGRQHGFGHREPAMDYAKVPLTRSML